jgi:hypothetical protein
MKGMWDLNSILTTLNTNPLLSEFLDLPRG